MAGTAVAPNDVVQLSPLSGEEQKLEGEVIHLDRRSSDDDGEAIQEAMDLQAEHENLNKQATESISVLGLEKYNTAMPVGLRALHKELSAFQTGTFRNMWRGSYYYISKDKMVLLTTFLMMMTATVFTFWAPQWIAVSARLIFGDGSGSISLGDFCGWLFLYVAALAFLWSATGSLLYVLYSRFVQRMRYHFATLGQRLYSRDSQIADSMFLERVESDVPQTAAFWFKSVPTVIVAVTSILMGFGMIFGNSWQVGLTALGLFAVFLLVSMLVDEVALRDAHVTAEEKRREDALWAKLHDHTTSPRERKECLMQINRIRALRASYGSHGLLHIVVGVVYRILAFCSPVILFLVAGQTVVDRDMDGYQVVVVSAYFAYIVIFAYMVNSVIMNAASRIGAGVKLMGFVNETHAGLASRERTRITQALQSTEDEGETTHPRETELRMATPWAVILLSFLFMIATVFITIVLLSNTSMSECPRVEYTCFLEMQEIGWSDSVQLEVKQEFDMSMGCSMEQSPKELLDHCAATLVEEAPVNMGMQTSEARISFQDWSGGIRSYQQRKRLPTKEVYDDRLIMNPLPEQDPVDLGPVSTMNMEFPCLSDPCGRNGMCGLDPESPWGFMCLCFNGWTGFQCEFPPLEDGGEGSMHNTTLALEDIERYKQCLNESVEFEPDAEELCNNLTDAVAFAHDHVEYMIEHHWFAYRHNEKMRKKRARKYQIWYERQQRQYQQDQEAENRHAQLEAACWSAREKTCNIFPPLYTKCMNILQDAQNGICRFFGWVPDAICTHVCPQNWECEVKPQTCYACEHAVCRKPRRQNIMIAGYHPTFNDYGQIRNPKSIVNIGGNATHVIDEFWGTTYENQVLQLLEPRYVAYMCGEPFFPLLEVAFPEPFYVTAFAVNGWGDQEFMLPPSFWTVEGSNDGPEEEERTWNTIGTANSDQWLTDESNFGYPFEEENVVSASAPGNYQYYRLNVNCPSQAQGLLIENWALFIEGDDPKVHDAFDDEA